MNRPPAPSPEQLLALLEDTIKSAPAFPYQGGLSADDLKWLGRADALLEASDAVSALVHFRAARSAINSYSHSRENLLIPLYDAFSRMELSVPSANKGAFIPGGDTWNGYAALVAIFQKECDEIFVVDPYLDASIYTDLAPHAVAKRGIKCLTANKQQNVPGLVAASKKWASDLSVNERKVEVRTLPGSALHDRLVIVNPQEVWLVSQSLRDIAKR